MDIKELQKKLEEREAELEELKTLHSNSMNEVERMRNHQETLLKETRDAKEKRKLIDEQFGELKKKVDAIEDKKLADDNNYEELIRRNDEKVRLEYETKLAEKDEALNSVQGSYNTLVAELNKKTIDTAIKAAAVKAGVLPTGYDDVINRSAGIFTLADDNSVEARDKEGNIRTIGKKQLTPSVFVETLKETAPHLWPTGKGAGATGSGAPINSAVNPFLKGDNFNRTAQTKLANENPELAKQMMEEAKAGAAS